jgi:hypothetical protein
MANIEFIDDSSNELRKVWLRKSLLFMDKVKKRENDLNRLRQSNATDFTIKSIDEEIEVMIDFYNASEMIINAFSLNALSLRAKLLLMGIENRELGKWLIELTKNDDFKRGELIEMLSKNQNI